MIFWGTFFAPTPRIRILSVHLHPRKSVSWQVNPETFLRKKWSSIIGTMAFECSKKNLVLPEQIQARSERFLYLVGNPHTHTYPSPPSCILSTRNQSKRPTVNQTDPRHAFVWAKGRISALQEQHTWSDPFVINLIVFLGFSNHSWTKDCR